MLALARFAALGLALAAPLAGAPPHVPEIPADLPEARSPEWGAGLARGAGLAEARLGVGHLRAVSGAPGVGHEWLKEALLPLYRNAAGSHWGWLARGWLLSADGSKRPFAADCLVETGYESSSITLAEMRDDGWFRLAADAPCGLGGEMFWSHRTLLNLGDHEFEVEPWQEFFFGEDVSPLSFRQAEIAHALRNGPSADAERVAWIGAEHSIEPLEVVGDWMRVRVFQPSNYCVGPEQWSGREDAGWIRWRDGLKGPWVFVWSRGC